MVSAAEDIRGVARAVPTANVQLHCNGSLVNLSAQGEFTLAGRSAKASRFVIQLKNGSEVFAEKSVIVGSEFPWQGLQHVAWFDPLGISVKTSTVVGGVWTPFSEWQPIPLLARGRNSHPRRPNGPPAIESPDAYYPIRQTTHVCNRLDQAAWERSGRRRGGLLRRRLPLRR